MNREQMVALLIMDGWEPIGRDTPNGTGGFTGIALIKGDHGGYLYREIFRFRRKSKGTREVGDAEWVDHRPPKINPYPWSNITTEDIQLYYTRSLKGSLDE